MNVLIAIALIVAGIIVLLLILALLMKKEHYVKREIVINAPQKKVFDYVKLLRNQDTFNKHAMAGPDRKKEFRGVDGTVGYVYAWSGNKATGEGEKEIMKIIEGKRMEAEIRFVKPMAASSYIIMDTEFLSENQTKLTWSNSGKLNYPVNLLIPMMERMLPKEMDSSLITLKSILEK